MMGIPLAQGYADSPTARQGWEGLARFRFSEVDTQMSDTVVAPQSNGKQVAIVMTLLVVQFIVVLALYPIELRIFGLPPVALGFMSLILSPVYLGILFNVLLRADDRSVLAKEPSAQENGDER